MSVLEMFKNKIGGSQVYYKDEELIFLKNFIKNTFGNFNNVIYDKARNFPIDIYVIEPTKERDYYTLVTLGMSAMKMNVPKEFDGYDYAELVIYMPKTWNLSNLKDINSSWPVHLLKSLSILPINNYTWLGTGHTVGNIGSYAPDTKMSNSLILCAMDDKFCPVSVKLGNNKINFYMVMPIYEEEYIYKKENGINALLDIFEKERLSFPPITSNRRKNFCEKK